MRNGFTNMKMRCGRDDTYDRAAVEAVITAIGSDARLAVDGTHHYQPEQAERFSALLSKHGVLWFEEPFPPEDVAAYATLRANTDVPIAAGENEYSVRDFRDLIQSGAIDIAQPDVSRAGGITECRRIAQLAESAGLRMTTHTWNDAVTVLASAHLIAASPNGWMIEVDGTDNPFIERLGTTAARDQRRATGDSGRARAGHRARRGRRRRIPCARRRAHPGWQLRGHDLRQGIPPGIGPGARTHGLSF